MSKSSSPMTQPVQCPVCSLQFNNDRGAGQLMAHLRDEHADISVAAYYVLTRRPEASASRRGSASSVADVTAAKYKARKSKSGDLHSTAKKRKTGVALYSHSATVAPKRAVYPRRPTPVKPQFGVPSRFTVGEPRGSKTADWGKGERKNGVALRLNNDVTNTGDSSLSHCRGEPKSVVFAPNVTNIAPKGELSALNTPRNRRFSPKSEAKNCRPISSYYGNPVVPLSPTVERRLPPVRIISRKRETSTLDAPRDGRSSPKSEPKNSRSISSYKPVIPQSPTAERRLPPVRIIPQKGGFGPSTLNEPRCARIFPKSEVKNSRPISSYYKPGLGLSQSLTAEGRSPPIINIPLQKGELGLSALSEPRGARMVKNSRPRPISPYHKPGLGQSHTPTAERRSPPVRNIQEKRNSVVTDARQTIRSPLSNYHERRPTTRYFPLSASTRLTTVAQTGGDRGTRPPCDATATLNTQPPKPRRKGRIKVSRNHFTATVETWWRAPGKVLCEDCGSLAAPLVRRQGHKMTKTSVGALCLLGCWPICFLPCFMNDSEMVDLYCARCNNFQGTFSKRIGKMLRVGDPLSGRVT